MNVKEEAITVYGGMCINCGASDYRILCFDHVYDDGNLRRKKCSYERAGGAKFAAKLKREGWPDYIQLLCFNCNHLKRIGELDVKALNIKRQMARNSYQ